MEKKARKAKATTSTMRVKSDSTIPSEARELEKAAVQCRNAEEWKIGTKEARHVRRRYLVQVDIRPKGKVRRRLPPNKLCVRGAYPGVRDIWEA